GLPDGLARRLDGEVVRGLDAAQRLPAFFFRRTFRGCCERAGAGFGAGPSVRAPLPPPSPSSRGGVRELRFSTSPIGVFGTSLRVISPCPTVQRFVVTQ